MHANAILCSWYCYIGATCVASAGNTVLPCEVGNKGMRLSKPYNTWLCKLQSFQTNNNNSNCEDIAVW